MQTNQKWKVCCDTDILTDVMLGSPEDYYWLATSSVAKDSIKKGFIFDIDETKRQHESLQKLFENENVKVHLVPPRKDLPDIVFTRDTTTMTPWGLLGLKMREPSRQPEVSYVLEFAKTLGVNILGRINKGNIEGGDICIARDDLLIVGCSGGRTSKEGVNELSRIFNPKGFEIYTYEFESFFLHLDTIFSLVSNNCALVCVDVIEEIFINFIQSIGLKIIPVSYKEMRKLGANILSLGNNKVISATHNKRINQAIRNEGIKVIEADITQFTLGGGGIHCLTMPLARTLA